MPSIVLGLLFLALSALTVFREPGSAEFLKPAMIAPRGFGRFVFERYWLAVEIISVLLLLGLLAAVQLGRMRGEDRRPAKNERGERP
jgi:NADH-quinone oxidoreductase subunit J